MNKIVEVRVAILVIAMLALLAVIIGIGYVARANGKQEGYRHALADIAAQGKRVVTTDRMISS